MARPIKSGKQSVNLAEPEVRVSRIRREPPPAATPTKLTLAPDERDRWVVVAGVVTFALALAVLIVAFGVYSGRMAPWKYHVQMHANG